MIILQIIQKKLILALFYTFVESFINNTICFTAIVLQKYLQALVKVLGTEIRNRPMLRDWEGRGGSEGGKEGGGKGGREGGREGKREREREREREFYTIIKQTYTCL